MTGDALYAEDLAQEAMTRVHRRWARVSTLDDPGAWARRVTINLAISRRRRLLRELGFRRSHRPEPPADLGVNLDGFVWDAVAQLPPRQRAVVALFYAHDLSTREIAETLGCSVSTATSHLNHARRRLADLLAEEGPLHES